MVTMDTTTGTTSAQETTAPQPPIDGRSKPTWDSQERFLCVFREVGTPTKACEATGIPYATYRSWLHHDAHQFTKRLDDARTEHGHRLEDVMFARLQNPEGNRGSDPLLMFSLKALFPDRYREAFPDTRPDEQARTLFDELKKRAKADGKAATPKIP